MKYLQSIVPRSCRTNDRIMEQENKSCWKVTHAYSTCILVNSYRAVLLNLYFFSFNLQLLIRQREFNTIPAKPYALISLK